jgi:hypothetical protein
MAEHCWQAGTPCNRLPMLRTPMPSAGRKVLDQLAVDFMALFCMADMEIALLVNDNFGGWLCHSGHQSPWTRIH